MDISDEESYDELVIDFDDDNSELAQSGTNFEILDEAVGGFGSTIASPTDINANSAAYVEMGPKLCHNASNWVLGVRHLSLSSKRLNDRMANRAVAVNNANQLYLNDSNQYDHIGKHWSKSFSSNAKKTNPLSNRSAIMNDIAEESAESFDTYHSHHQKNNSTHYRVIGVTKIKEKRQYNTPADQIFISDARHHQNYCDNSNVFHHLNKRQSERFKKLASKQQSSNVESFGNKADYFSEQIDTTRIDHNNTGSKTRCENNNDLLKTQVKSKKSETRIKSLKNAIIPQNNETSTKLSNYKRSVNLVALTAKQELQRYRRQCICESISLMIIVVGLILVITTPFLLIPIWVIPNAYSPIIRNILWLSLGLSVLLLALAAMTGNVYWYYDEKSQKWKWFYHCGKGPADHYWGSTILHNNKKLNVCITV